MSEPPPPESSSPELQTLMDAKIQIKGLNSAADQPNLQAAVAGKAGIVSVEFGGDKLAVRYDPEQITVADICALVRQAGFHVAGGESAPTSPPIESSERQQERSEAMEGRRDQGHEEQKATSRE